jgi:hypothetical protein
VTVAPRPGTYCTLLPAANRVPVMVVVTGCCVTCKAARKEKNA